jgi:hypothetical protein
VCDCYTDHCKVCKEPIEMHLADFSTGQDEIGVYCERHIPQGRKNGLVWLYGDGRMDKKMFVRWLTDNARANAYGNHPNYTEAEVEDIPPGTLLVSKERACSGVVPGRNRRSKKGRTSSKGRG